MHLPFAPVLVGSQLLIAAAAGVPNVDIRKTCQAAAGAMTELMAASAEEGPRLIGARAVYRTACVHAAESAVRIADLLASETVRKELAREVPYFAPLAEADLGEHGINLENAK